jgi:hypothetical protein
MRFIKLAIISIIILFLLVTAISLFIPSKIRISKAVDIKSSREKVILQITHPTQWKYWFPGADSLELLYIKGEAKGIVVDSQLHRSIIISERNDSSVIALYGGPGAREIVNGWRIITGNEMGFVTVQWWMDFKLRWYPWEKFSSLFFENIYGVEMEKGLDNLKRLAEANRSSIN